MGPKKWRPVFSPESIGNTFLEQKGLNGRDSLVPQLVWNEGRKRFLQPRSQGLFPGLGAGREKALASAGHVPTLHPEILGVIN